MLSKLRARRRYTGSISAFLLRLGLEGGAAFDNRPRSGFRLDLPYPRIPGSNGIRPILGFLIRTRRRRGRTAPVVDK